MGGASNAVWYDCTAPTVAVAVTITFPAPFTTPTVDTYTLALYPEPSTYVLAYPHTWLKQYLT